jgi:hypothetical protein
MTPFNPTQQLVSQRFEHLEYLNERQQVLQLLDSGSPFSKYAIASFQFGSLQSLLIATHRHERLVLPSLFF